MILASVYLLLKDASMLSLWCCAYCVTLQVSSRERLQMILVCTRL